MEIRNPKRREFLKTLLLTIGAFFLGFFSRSLGFLNFLSKEKSKEEKGEEKIEEPLTAKTFIKWKVVEKDGKVVFLDKATEEEVLILEEEE